MVAGGPLETKILLAVELLLINRLLRVRQSIEIVQAQAIAISLLSVSLTGTFMLSRTRDPWFSF